MPQVTLDNRCHIAISGEDAENFLHNLITTDVVGLPEDTIGPGALLAAQGKVNYAFLINRSHQGFVLDVAGQDAVDFAKKLKFFRLRAKVQIGEPEPVPQSIVWNEAKPEGLLLKDTRFSSVEVWRGAATAPNNADESGWTALRIAHGVSEPHLDYAYSDVFPHDINLDQTGGLSFKKGCYVGQEVVSRMHHRGTARWRLMVAKGPSLTPGMEISAGSKPAGIIGSVSKDTALALVRLDRIKHALDEQLQILAGDVSVALQFPIGVSYDWPQNVDATP